MGMRTIERLDARQMRVLFGYSAQTKCRARNEAGPSGFPVDLEHAIRHKAVQLNCYFGDK